MSKERARRRAAREAVLEAERAVRARRTARRARWRALTAFGRRFRDRLRVLGRRRPRSVLRRVRGRQNLLLAAVVLAGNALVWLLSPSGPVRAGVAVTCVLAWPLLVVLVYDRGRSV